MDRMQKQSILIVLQSIEQQVAALKGLVMLGSQPAETASGKSHKASSPSNSYTSDDEDAAIGSSIQEGISETEVFLHQVATGAKPEKGPVDGQ